MEIESQLNRRASTSGNALTHPEKGLGILHVCTDLPNHTIYSHLLSGLSTVGFKQIAVSAVRSTREANWVPPEINNCAFHINMLLRKAHKIFYRHKIAKVSQFVESKIDLTEVNVIHAHTFYSDGGVAFHLHKKFGIPFIVALRNVDVNYFMKYRPDLAWQRNRILRSASRVIFLSPTYQTKVLAALPPALAKEVQIKSQVIANGLDESWLAPLPNEYLERSRNETLKVLYVGDSSANKNISGLISAVNLLPGKATLSIVGFNAAQARDTGLPAPSATLQYLGRINDPTEIRKIYRQHDVFAMPSFRETFGVTYIEALSQGLPVVHSAGQGIDGYFPPNKVSESADPHSPESIKNAILRVGDRLPEIRSECHEAAKQFSWSQIVAEYSKLYYQATGCKPQA